MLVLIPVSLAGYPLLIVLAVFALALPIALALGWRKLPHRLGAVILRVLVIILCQLLALAAVFVGVNRNFGFYDSWNDLLGRRQDPGAVAVADIGSLLADNGSQGQVKFLTVHGKVSGTTQQVLVWLPPQYFQKAYAKTNFPVLMALPGQPGSQAGIFRTLNLATRGLAAVNSGAVKPFIAIVPPLSIAAPRDTECTDIPNGPQADSWLSSDVRDGVITHYRVTHDHWSTMGWSTGAFCASKMLLRHPTAFGAAVSIGGYFTAEQDHTTGNLFNHSKTLFQQNSPLWLLKHTLSYPVHLLIISSPDDRESWKGKFYADTRKTVQASRGIPGVSTIIVPSGGHNFSTYDGTVAPALAWLGKNAAL